MVQNCLRPLAAGFIAAEAAVFLLPMISHSDPTEHLGDLCLRGHIGLHRKVNGGIGHGHPGHIKAGLPAMLLHIFPDRQRSGKAPTLISRSILALHAAYAAALTGTHLDDAVFEGAFFQLLQQRPAVAQPGGHNRTKAALRRCILEALHHAPGKGRKLPHAALIAEQRLLIAGCEIDAGLLHPRKQLVNGQHRSDLRGMPYIHRLLRLRTAGTYMHHRSTGKSLLQHASVGDHR